MRLHDTGAALVRDESQKIHAIVPEVMIDANHKQIRAKPKHPLRQLQTVGEFCALVGVQSL